MDTLTRDTARSYIWNQLAFVLDGLTLTLASVCVGRLAGRDALGTFSWVLSMAGLVALVAALGFKEGIAVLVQKVEDDAALRGLFRRLLTIRLWAAVVTVVVTAVLLWHRASPPIALGVAAYVGAVLVAGLLSAFNVALFQTRAVAFGKIASCIVSVGIVAAGAAVGSVALAFVGLSIGTIVGGALFFLPLRRIAFGPASPCRLSHALQLPLTLAIVAVSNYLIGSQAASFLLKYARIADGEIAVFSVGVTVAFVSNRALMGGFTSVILAAFSRAADAEHLARLHSLYVRATTILSMPMLLASVVFAPLIARIWLKGDIGDSAFIINVLVAWSIAARLMGGGAHSAALYSSGLQNIGLVVRAFFGALSVVAVYFAAAHMGIRTAASAAGAVGFLVIAVEWIVVYRMRAIGMPWTALARLTLYSLAASVPAWLLTLPGRPALTILAVPIFALGAIAALILAKPLSAGEASDIAGHGLLSKVLVRLETPASAATLESQAS